LGSGVVVWRWVWIARSRKRWRQAICIWRWGIVLAIGSCRRRILIAWMSRIWILRGRVLAVPLMLWRLILSYSWIIRVLRLARWICRWVRHPVITRRASSWGPLLIVGSTIWIFWCRVCVFVISRISIPWGLWIVASVWIIRRRILAARALRFVGHVDYVPPGFLFQLVLVVFDVNQVT
jgi:hypothetical protein